MAKHQKSLFLALALSQGIVAACSHTQPGDAKASSYNAVPRTDFNRIAAELALPLFWVEDKNNNSTVDPDEVNSFWGLKASAENNWVDGAQFSKTFQAAYESIAAHYKTPLAPVKDPVEAKRRAAVLEELHQGRQTIVQTDFSKSSEEDKQIVRHIFEAAVAVERIFAKQTGVDALKKQLPADDTASQMLFFRNQSAWCHAPKTEKNPDCNAIAGNPKRISGLYPASLQAKDPKFCETLAARKDADSLLSPFVVVSESKDGNYGVLPYNAAFSDDMIVVSNALKAAADAIKSSDEQPFKTYLLAAAQSFLDNNWQPADEAWSKMNTQNSKWYLRVGPDETYGDPCSRKAGFHVSFALINKSSLAWQKKLDPLKNDMEKAFAEVAGKPYKAHPVSFHLPDFIDVVLNAGDARAPHGATIGQSLPNWGPVANEGRGRTVAMINFYKDADSKADSKKLAQSMFCPATMDRWIDNDDAGLLDTLLHEASHNLGPSHEYKVKGKTDDQIFGGPTAAMLEELKAQTGSLFFAEWLLEKKLLDKALVEQSHLSFATWAFGHISSGMYDGQGKAKPYSQLAAIQLGFLLKEKAAVWLPNELAANTQDKGCMNIDVSKFAKVVPKLAKVTVGLKARGDTKVAAQLKADYIDSKVSKALQATIAERWLRAPKASFVYSVKL
ncbi:MAG: hypothetical protein H7318_09360 [Oligoflexus sp.]|nr:hypothetical protein [Oligoflexus sp.]